MGLWQGVVSIENEPGGDLKDWLVTKPLAYAHGPIKVTVLPGATTDGASIPRFFWRVIGGPFSGRYTAAALIHDQLYATWGVNGQLNRKFADDLFKAAMLDSGVSRVKAATMHRAVRLMSGKFWDRHSGKDIHEQLKFIEVEFAGE